MQHRSIEQTGHRIFIDDPILPENLTQILKDFVGVPNLLAGPFDDNGVSTQDDAAANEFPDFPHMRITGTKQKSGFIGVWEMNGRRRVRHAFRQGEGHRPD